ncbi:JAB domain-containing protein [Weissella ceti]|uniref:JAB domain-containing protein n=1 Tax=Weissella ceti TaxID=759620 RepID=A0ABT3E2L2_9LACO|nr:JAB domain-containing protein [Weissella ceti]MCW0952647.1 JAB domain-containing protein [Weissella ceti]QVK12352.1 JAB domain-containing protein [Weissella ceti]
MKITSIEGLGNQLYRQYGHEPQEHCWVLSVNTQMEILDYVQVALGTINHVTIHPRDVFRRLVSVNAYGYILVHNHPGGGLNPSEADMRILQQFVACSALMQIHLLDFMIISKSGYYSVRTKQEWPEISLNSLLDLWT